MFSEYFIDEDWQTLMPGIRCCMFAPQQTDEGDLQAVSIQMRQSNVEILFCIHGKLVLHHRSGQLEQLGDQEILLITDCSNLDSAEVEAPLEGVCLVVDCMAAQESLKRLCQIYGDLPITMKQVGEIMRARGGVYPIFHQSWTRSTFHALENLAPGSRGQYCMMKCFELIFLLDMCQTGTGITPAQQGAANPMETAEAICAYLSAHLHEKLTINELSRRFHLSPTACKSCFRACFGESIHHWLLTKRMERAAELLLHSDLPILQVAQAVGYDGSSQFNAVFKKRYGVSPRQYRNHVRSR